MTDLEIRPCFGLNNRLKYIANRPVDFETWLDFSFRNPHFDTELVNGVIVERVRYDKADPKTDPGDTSTPMAAQYPHEWIFVWFLQILGVYVSHRNLGKVLGSRTAVKIIRDNGRLPDLVFVRADNLDIIHDDAIHGVPDLVIEIVSANDYPYLLNPLETEYRSLGIPEIVFINPKKKQVRCLKKTETDYDETMLNTGRLEFSCIPGFGVEVEWIFADEKPDQFIVTKQLIEAAEAGDKNTSGE